MAPEESALTTKASADVTQHIDPSQALRAATALLRKIQSDQASRVATAEKTNLLADADDDDDDAEDATPVWLVLTTKKHVVDKKRLKPGKITLPHPYLDTTGPNLRICLITADPQRKYKDLIAHPSFPPDLAKRIHRVIGVTKLKAKYKSFESRRQLLGEYDVFLADDRVITYLPQVLGKVFYKAGNKRPVPITLEGRRQSRDEHGNKRRKLSEGGVKVTKSDVKPTDMAKEIERTLSSALVHLAPSTTTAVKVGHSSMQPQQIQENVEAVTHGLVERYVPHKWSNVRAIHMKGPDTAALPVWLAEELWQNENDVLDHALPAKKTKKRKRDALAEAAAGDEASAEVIEVPGPDGKTRRLEKASAESKGAGAGKSKASLEARKKRASTVSEDAAAKATERAEKAARKEALQKQKAVAKGIVNVSKQHSEAATVPEGAKKSGHKVRTKTADLI